MSRAARSGRVAASRFARAARGLAGILSWAPFALAAAPGALPHPVDLRVEGQAVAREGKPLVVLFSQQGCSWCEKARIELAPMARGAAAPPPALFRQIDLDSDADLVGFHGERTSQRAFAQGDGVRFTPTVVIYGPDGERLADPIVGMRLPDFYGHYVEQAIEQAKNHMKIQGSRNTP